MRRRLVAGIACFAVAALAAVLARDVWDAEHALADDDARAEVSLAESGSWKGAQTLPFGLARELLAIDDDIAYRALIERAIRLARVPARTPAQTRRRAPLEASLGRLEAGADQKRASQAAVLLGVLLYTDPEDRYRQLKTPIEKAVERFRSAARLDAGNETAMFDLELLLRQERSRNPRGRSAQAGGDRAGGGAAGLAPAGRGY